MIIVGESDPNAREVPFHLPDENNPLVGKTGHVFVDGEVKIRLPGASYANATVANIVEKGFGDYALRLTQAQTANEGFAYLYAAVAGAQRWTGVEQIATQPSGIIRGETVDARRELAFHLPDENDPLTGVTGHVFAAGEVKLCLPGGTYADADVSRVVEKGFGDYALRLTDAEVAAKGKVYLRVKIPGAQRWTAWYEIVDEYVLGGALSAPIISNITPTKGAQAGVPGAFSSSYSVARFTPIEFDLTNIVPGAGITIAIKFEHRDETYTILDTTADSERQWKWPFDAHSSIGDLSAEPVHVSLLPRDGWPPVPWEIKVAAVQPAVEP